MFGKLLFLVTLAHAAYAQTPLTGLREVRTSVSVVVMNGPSPSIDTAAIASSLKTTLRAGGLRVMDRTTEGHDESPLIFFRALVSVVKIVSPTPVIVYAISYEYNVTENARLTRSPFVVVPVSSWSAGGAVQVVSDPAALSGIIERMVVALSQKLNQVRGGLDHER